MKTPSTIMRLGVLALLLALLTGTQALAQKVVINGVPLVTSRTPVTMAGSILLPMRDVFEALNSEIKWFASEQKIIATRGNTVIQLWIGRKNATINGQVVPMPVAPQLLAGSTYVPLRFPAEAFGGDVKWDGPAATAFITIPESTPGSAGLAGNVTPANPSAVTPPVTQAPAVDGVVVQVLQTPPGLVIQAAETGILQAVPVTPATTVTRGNVETQLQPAKLSDVRPGDLAHAELGANGVATQVTLKYGQATGKVIALTAGLLVLEDGSVYRLSDNLRVLDPAGQPLNLTAVAPNSQVIIIYEPQTKVAWEVRLTSAAQAAQPDAQGQILTVGLANPSNIFKGGETLKLQLRGARGGQAHVTVENIVRDLPLTENEPGIYSADYQLAPGTDVNNAQIIGDLTIGGVKAPSTISATRVTIDSTPPLVTDMAPRPGEVVNTVSPTIQITFDEAGGTPLNRKSARLWVGRREVTGNITVTNQRLSYVAENLPQGPVQVEATISDAAGNEGRINWSFTVGVPRTNVITSVSHDAQRTLVTGDILTVTMRVAATGGQATFDVGDKHGIAMAQQADNLYAGTYTVQQGDRIINSPVTAHYRDPQGREAAVDTNTPVTIDSTLPNALNIVTPRDGEQVGDTIRVSGQAPLGRRVRVTISFRTRVITWLTGQLWQDTLQADDQGQWQSPPIDSSIGLFGKANEYSILAELLDDNNNVVSQKTIKLHK